MVGAHWEGELPTDFPPGSDIPMKGSKCLSVKYLSRMGGGQLTNEKRSQVRIPRVEALDTLVLR